MDDNNNDMVTLNIYNQPSPKLANETEVNMNETGQNFNTDRPPLYFDNIRENKPQNYNSDPRYKKPQKKNMQSSIDESSSSSDNNQNHTPIMNQPQYQYQQPIYYQQIIGQNNQMGYPMVPYNYHYGQPVVIPNAQIKKETKPVNNAPNTIIIKERQKKSNNAGSCCEGCLAGCLALCAVCCMCLLCCPGPHGPHGRGGPHGRW